jgi:hypothetical protein
MDLGRPKIKKINSVGDDNIHNPIHENLLNQVYVQVYHQMNNMGDIVYNQMEEQILNILKIKNIWI